MFKKTLITAAISVAVASTQAWAQQDQDAQSPQQQQSQSSQSAAGQDSASQTDTDAVTAVVPLGDQDDDLRRSDVSQDQDQQTQTSRDRQQAQTQQAQSSQERQAQGAQAPNQQARSQQRDDQAQQEQAARIHLSPAAVRELQQAIDEEGFDIASVDGIWGEETMQAAREYQRANRLEPTGTPTIQLIHSLELSRLLEGQAEPEAQRQQRQTAASQGNGSPVYISPNGIRQIQQALNDAGHDVGAVDGLWGPSTSQAARRYQQANNLEANGRLDVPLIASLGLSEQIFSPDLSQQAEPQQPGGQQDQSAQAQQGPQTGVASQQQQDRQQDQARQQTRQDQGVTGLGEPLYAGAELIRQVEQNLARQGFEEQEVNGTWEDETAQAAVSYMREQNMEPAGVLTTDLLESLDVEWMSGDGFEAAMQESEESTDASRQAGV